jgi:hypothetical protein
MTENSIKLLGLIPVARAIKTAPISYGIINAKLGNTRLPFYC